MQDFKEFLEQREDVASAYVRGDAEPLRRIVTHVSPTTFYAPNGGYVEGAFEVTSRYTRDAASFGQGAKSHLEILHMEANNGFAYWVGFQHATAYFQGKNEPVQMKLRITEIFRREGDEWKMLHRHADTLVDVQKLQ